MTPEQAARVCHEASRELRDEHGDHSLAPWDLVPDWQKQGTIQGVVFHLDNPGADAAASHEEWMRIKEADGWTYGPIKNADRKEHPCLVPFDQLPPDQQANDALFRAIVHALRPLLRPEDETEINQLRSNAMNEAQVEQEIQDKGLNAPRLSPELIDAKIDEEQYHVFPGTTVTVCCMQLANGYCVIGHSAAASPENFDPGLGRKIAREHARDQIWGLEGYLLRQRLTDQTAQTETLNT